MSVSSPGGPVRAGVGLVQSERDIIQTILQAVRPTEEGFRLERTWSSGGALTFAVTRQGVRHLVHHNTTQSE